MPDKMTSAECVAYNKGLTAGQEGLRKLDCFDGTLFVAILVGLLLQLWQCTKLQKLEEHLYEMDTSSLVRQINEGAE